MTLGLPEKWTELYQAMVSRQLGYVNIADQQELKCTRILVAGVGGVGGPLVEQLVRMGCENIVILDSDVFEPSNLNRQLCTTDDMGRLKVEVIAERMTKINPDVTIALFRTVEESNVDEILKDVKIVALCLDGPVGSILLARACRCKGIPMVETWATPFLFSWWFLPDSASYEQVYKLNTQQYTISQIQENSDLTREITACFVRKFLVFPQIIALFMRHKRALVGSFRGELPLRSLCPVVWLAAAYLAKEILYHGVIHAPRVVIAPQIKGYDYIRQRSFNLSPTRQHLNFVWNSWVLKRLGVSV